MDTGPLVAYVDAGDSAHEVVSEGLASFSGRLCTTSAVVTEAMHLVADAAEGPEVLVEFLVAAGVDIAEIATRGHLQSAVRLMKKYHETPMDFADATLVLLAEQLSVTDILTLDRRGFSAYRTAAGKAFRLVLPSTR